MIMGIVSLAGYTFGSDLYILHGGEKEVYCIKESHPKKGFRAYRRGFMRCKVCGAKKGWVMNFDDYNGTIGNSNIKSYSTEK